MTKARQCGTPSYMAPEQAAGHSSAIQPAVDIYSLGAVLYELLTGRPPFTAETSAETLQQVINDDPVAPSRLNPRVPCDLQTICLKCLQKDPARRYRSAAELADDLQRFTRGEPIMARPVGTTERTLKWCRRHPSATIAIAVSVIAMAGVVAGGIWLQQIEHARHTQELVRREGARRHIDSALPLLSRLAESRQWSDANGVLRTAQARLEDAQSPEHHSRLAAAAEEVEVAEELDRIRQSFPEPNVQGYSVQTARDEYGRAFTRVGIGSDTSVELAAKRVRESHLREDLLAALDHAAFTERYNADHTELGRLLSVGRTASPNPWQDRFRDPATWQDLESLRRLVNDAAFADPAPPSHQLVMVGILLSSKDDDHATIKILREAQLREPADFWVNLELGRALSRNQNHNDAIQYYRAAVALRPTHYVAWTSIGHSLLSSGRPVDAIAPLRKAVAIQPKYPTSWQTLIHAFAACERWDEALQTRRDAVSANPRIALSTETTAVLHLCQARSAVLKGKWPLAANSYAQAIDGHYAISSHAFFEFATAQVLAGDAAGYRAVCATMRERCERDGIRRFLVARACTLATIPDPELQRAIELGMPELDLHPDLHWSLTERAALLCRQGQYQEAIPLLKRSLISRTRPDECIVAWVWLSRAHLSLGDHDAAKSWIEKSAAYLDQHATKPAEIHLHDWLEAQILRREVETELAL